MTVYCSFCGKAEQEVFYIVEGPASGICDECVPLCADVIADKRAAVARGEPIVRRKWKSTRAFLEQERVRTTSPHIVSTTRPPFENT